MWRKNIFLTTLIAFGCLVLHFGLVGAGWGAYVQNGDFTVTDTSTGLIWQQFVEDQQITWQNALSYCEELSLAGYADWRLPNLHELRSIVDDSRNTPALDPVFGNNSYEYWSSTTWVAMTSGAWRVNFIKGEANGYTKINLFSARCVRGDAIELSELLNLLRPNGREVLIKGENYNITWYSQNVTGTIQIDLYKGGRTSQYFFRQISAAAPNTGSYRFIPPIDIPNSNDYLIRISSNSESIQDFSRAFFTITDTPPNTNRPAPWNLLLLLN